MAFFLLSQPREFVVELANAFLAYRDRIHPCRECGNLTEEEVCSVCSDPLRDRKTICVVETAEDCLSIEQAGIYEGLYHVLNGRVSPLDNEDLPRETLERLKSRVKALGVKEVILATNPRIEGDLTAFALVDELKTLPVIVSRLSYGLPVGGSIGFADRVTLHVALESRAPIKGKE